MGLNKKSLVMRGSAAEDGIGPCFGAQFFLQIQCISWENYILFKLFILATIGTFFSCRCGANMSTGGGFVYF
jgi:hypothetical protein